MHKPEFKNITSDRTEVHIGGLPVAEIVRLYHPADRYRDAHFSYVAKSDYAGVAYRHTGTSKVQIKADLKAHLAAVQPHPAI